MDLKLVKEYLEYANTKEAIAILLVKENIPESKGYWVDIVKCDYIENIRNVFFKSIVYAFYKRKIKPRYPNKSLFTKNGKFDKHNYYLSIRSITWEAANDDIAQQKSNGVFAKQYTLKDVKHNSSRTRLFL